VLNKAPFIYQKFFVPTNGSLMLPAPWMHLPDVGPVEGCPRMPRSPPTISRSCYG